MKKTLLGAAAFSLIAAGLSVAATAKSAPRAAAAARDWRNTITLTPDRNPIMGNPAAPLKIVEYISYACSHCADFVRESKARLEDDLVRRGQVAVERRAIVLENQPYALVAALAAHCGAPSRWFGNGDAMMAAQPQWLPKVIDPALQKKWNSTPANRYAVTMAQDLGFFQIMQARGYTRAQVTACLGSKPSFDAIIKTTNYGFVTIGITGTPTFLVNDSIVSFHNWSNLEALIDSMLPQ